MEILKIKGGRPLIGSIPVSGAKNSALALLPATLLAETPCTIENVPAIRDVRVFVKLLRRMGAEVVVEGSTLSVDAARVTNRPMIDGGVRSLRASCYLMGALLGRFGEAVVGLPGGCHLGPRPIDQHIKGFEALGATVSQRDGAIHLKAPRLKGARIYLDVVSVGATINIMLAAVFAEGLTVIENAAKEPEIVDVATFLNGMGARIKGAGTDVIRIRGTSRLNGCRHAIIPDRIEAGTYMIAAAATGGEVRVDQVIPLHLEPISAKLREMGIPVTEGDESVTVKGPKSLLPVDIKTHPYPGFPTDLQPPFTTLLTQAAGTSLVIENVSEGRLRHVLELNRMGARIRTDGRMAMIEGGTPLTGIQVRAVDLRAGAALVVAGLIAEGETVITDIHHIDRGYEQIDGKLRQLGADVRRE
ncbi:UDP-N-acetylglucosamine 1-carboxyvinyltransferase [Planifilum fimeticola]|uniref:UDP-N-acetylglucosamine 1-carboxyvinyltransferase n=1 Tax=Planifilum fimeticola TaxID=201975 RepID=A0A2T0LIC0_9BACL|nr:UDP-N-acetylglucosamine 1-carboxyvinyltransferase [Planifilum fimeticola]PRX42052.1 UDP-N-acetylglucosamine 1-carboxyvinyltransferase [Planifilum fimeticola]